MSLPSPAPRDTGAPAADPAPGDGASSGPPGWMIRVGEASLLALGISLFTSVPTALRSSAAGASFPDGLLVGTAVLLPLLALALGLVRGAGRGFRGITGGTSPRAIALGVAIWVGLATPLMAGLAAVLKAGTNHRGLGGATFGILAAAVLVGSCVLAYRLVAVARGLVRRGLPAWIVAAVGAAIGVLPILLVALTMSPDEGDAPPGGALVRAAIFDGMIALVATALVASIELPPRLRRVVGTWGVPVALLVVFAGAARIESSPPLAAAVRAGGGLAATLLTGLEAWSDADGDGMGAHFGGADCDEGDPARRLGAPEVPGDGVDQDCDGLDAAIVADASQIVAPPTIEPAAAAPRPAPAPADARPDIILITLDTVRADHTSAYGYDRDTTPALAALAKRGTLFERAYATASDTQRALCPLVSGKRLSQTPRDRREWPTLAPEVDTLAERLARAGYQTGAVTSFTWLSEERGFAQGFGRFEAVFQLAHPERAITGDHAVTAVRSVLAGLAKQPAPIFLWVHLFDAHERYEPHPGAAFGKGTVGRYDGEVAFVDRKVAEILSAVEASPRASRTAWVVHGSNGEGFGEHGSSGHGAELYDEVLRVPLVVALPGLPEGRAGTRVPVPVSTIDVAPTVLAIAGASADGMEGVSLVPAASGEAFTRGPVLARSARRGAVVAWPLKLIRTHRPKKDRVLLFDLAEDGGETKDLSAARPDDLHRLLATLDTFEGAKGP